METLLRLIVRHRARRVPIGVGRFLGFLVIGSLTQIGLWAQGESDIGGSQYLVLRNGQVIAGKVTHLGDRTLVTLPSGGEVNLPTKEVLLTCQDLLEAHHHLAERIQDRRTASPYVELARWCLRHDLLEQASEQLAKAQEIDRKHTALPVLERQLERAQKQAKLAAVSKLPAETVASHTGLAELGSSPGNPGMVTTPRPARKHPPTTEELEKAMQSIPREGVELFVNTIQPMMWNKCGTNRCHDVGGDSDFRVLRPANGNQVWRRLSLRNLHTLLGYVDRDDPDDSLLLEKSRTSHGGLQAPPLGGEDSIYYQQLLIWVRGVAGPRARLARTPTAESAPREASQSASGVVARASFEAPLSPEDPRPEDPRPEDPRPEDPRPEDPQEVDEFLDTKARRPKGTEAGDPEAPYRPRDPFDPEVFNRKFLRR